MQVGIWFITPISAMDVSDEKYWYKFQNANNITRSLFNPYPWILDKKFSPMYDVIRSKNVIVDFFENISDKGLKLQIRSRFSKIWIQNANKLLGYVRVIQKNIQDKIAKRELKYKTCDAFIEYQK